MAADMMTKEDAYRMAQVETEDQYMARMQEAQKKELAWVKENIIPAAAYIRGMAEKQLYLKDGGWWWNSPCGTFGSFVWSEILTAIRLCFTACGATKSRSTWRAAGIGLLPSAEFQSYRADWHDKTLAELEELFGYIA